MNESADRATLGHELPFAISPCVVAQRSLRVLVPPCEYSPSWVAITAARGVGAEVLFMDLPAWHGAFREVENRYPIATARRASVWPRSASASASRTATRLWGPHVFEQTAPHRQYSRARPTVYFEGSYAGELMRRRSRHAGRRRNQCRGFAGDGAEGGRRRGGVRRVSRPRCALTKFDDVGQRSTARPDVPDTDAGVRIGSYLSPIRFTASTRSLVTSDRRRPRSTSSSGRRR